MTYSPFKKATLISLLGHLTVFSIFTLSFGVKIPKVEYSAVAFWGSVLRNSDLITKPSGAASNAKIFTISGLKEVFTRKSAALLLEEANKEYPVLSDYYSKPQVTLAFSQDKIIPIEKASFIPFAPSKKESVIMFYPQLPYNFLLYFKDRQAVHIELMFNIITNGDNSSIAIKRKISSGNLEADLLSMRYISHYLFIEQARFQPNSWQRVKIDLKAKND